MSTSILLFAAGLGTRMGGMVKDKPKPMVHVGGKALIDHALQWTTVDGIGARVANVHYRAEVLRRHLRDTDVFISDETEALLETGGGLKNALPFLESNPVLTINTDAVWKGLNPVKQLLDLWQDHMEALLLLIPKAKAFGHQGIGDFDIQETGTLIRAPSHIYTGLQMIRTEAVAAIPEDAFSMNVIWDQISERGGLYGALYDGRWCDVGQPSSIQIAEDMLDV